MRFSSLGSGSAGNATLLQWEHEGLNHHLLLDCGFSERELAYRLAERGLSIESLDAILITHEHGDHLGKLPKSQPAMILRFGRHSEPFVRS